MKNAVANEVAATGAGLAGFALFSAVLAAPLIVSGVGAVGIYLGAKFLTSGSQKKLLPPDYEKIVDQIKLEADAIKALNKQIQDKKIKEKVDKVTFLTGEILERIQDNKSLVIDASDFLITCLSSTHTILSKYVLLLSADYPYEKINDTFEKLDSVLSVVLRSLEKEYQKILDGDLQDLDTEMEVLQKTIKYEG